MLTESYILAALGNAISVIHNRATMEPQSAAIRCGEWALDAANCARKALKALNTVQRCVEKLDNATSNRSTEWDGKIRS